MHTGKLIDRINSAFKPSDGLRVMPSASALPTRFAAEVARRAATYRSPMSEHLDDRPFSSLSANGIADSRTFYTGSIRQR